MHTLRPSLFSFLIMLLVLLACAHSTAPPVHCCVRANTACNDCCCDCYPALPGQRSYLSNHYGLRLYATNTSSGTSGITSTLVWNQTLVNFATNPGAYKGFLGIQDGRFLVSGGILARRIFFQNGHFNWTLDRLAFADARVMGYAASRTEYLCLNNPCGLGTCTVTLTGYRWWVCAVEFHRSAAGGKPRHGARRTHARKMQ